MAVLTDDMKRLVGARRLGFAETDDLASPHTVARSEGHYAELAARR